jgi:hypothetical protein
MPLNQIPFDFDQLWADYSRPLTAWQPYSINFPIAPLSGPSLPAGLTPSDFDPFSNFTRLSRHSHGLISAGVIAPGKPHLLALPMHNVIGNRPKSTCYVVGDSGGFQIITMNLPVTNQWRAYQLAWSELHCDAALPLDVPSAAVYVKGNAYYGKFGLALQHSVESHEFWRRNCQNSRSGESDSRRMRRLIVLQGHTPQQAWRWYDRIVKQEGYIWEGVAVGGDRRKHLGHLALLVLEMRRDGLLDTLEHLHVLGFANIGYAVCLTALKRAIEDEIGRPILLTFDVSTPFQYAYIFQQAIIGVDWSGRQPTLKTTCWGRPAKSGTSGQRHRCRAANWADWGSR